MNVAQILTFLVGGYASAWCWRDERELPYRQGADHAQQTGLEEPQENGGVQEEAALGWEEQLYGRDLHMTSAYST